MLLLKRVQNIQKNFESVHIEIAVFDHELLNNVEHTSSHANLIIIMIRLQAIKCFFVRCKFYQKNSQIEYRRLAYQHISSRDIVVHKDCITDGVKVCRALHVRTIHSI